MKKVRVAINGFGRIGRTLGRLLAYADDIEWVAVNDLSESEVLTHLFKYDSVHGPFSGNVINDGNKMVINDHEILFFHEADPENLPWNDLEIDIVIESTGKFKTRDGASKHLIAGAKKVVLSAPGKGEGIKTYVRGLNCGSYKDGKEDIIDNASCTTNCTAPVVQVMNDIFGVEKAMLTTIHAYTSDQNLQDGPHKDCGGPSRSQSRPERTLSSGKVSSSNRSRPRSVR